jgi:excisionase family DNA binding protein
VTGLQSIALCSKGCYYQQNVGVPVLGAKKGDWFFVDEDELLSVEEMTRILKVSRPTIQRWCRDRKLPAAKIGKAYRIRREDLDKWYEGKLIEAVKQ